MQKSTGGPGCCGKLLVLNGTSFAEPRPGVLASPQVATMMLDEGRIEGIEGIDGNVSRGEELAHGVQAADEAVGGLTVMAEPLTGGRRDGKSFWR